MIKQTINVHHKKFAAGLFWQPVGIGNTPYNYARQLAKIGNKRYTLYTDYKSMIGLTNGREGARFGMPSAAVEIMESLTEFSSFLGVFKTNDNRFYLLAVRNGIIIRDIIIDQEANARKLYAELSGIPDWGALFAPASWGMPKSQEKFLSDLIVPNNTARLRNISFVKSVLPSLFFVLLFVFAVVYILRSPIGETIIPKKQVRLDPEIAEEYQRQIDLKNQELDKQFDIVKKEIEPLHRPYEDLPDMMERARLCYKGIAFVMQPITGWNQTYAKCDDKYVSATFKRDFGTLNDFYGIGSSLMPGAIVQQMNENEIIVRVMLPVLETKSSLEERDQNTTMRDITTNFQKINTNVNISGKKENITNGEETEDIYSIELSAVSKLKPTEFMQVFRDFEGVYMNSVNWNANTRTWNYEVTVYTK